MLWGKIIQINRTALANQMDWDLRREILQFSHYWPLTFLAFLLGSLIGIGLSYLFPVPYRAEAGLSVVFDLDISPRNPDDFKNWYLEQLNVFIYSDPVIDHTLASLRTQDPTWETATRDDLRSSLHAYWRSAGKWRLVAEAPDAARAAAMVRAWEDAVLSSTAVAISHASKMQDLTNQYNHIVELEAASRMHSLELNQARQAIQSWLASYGQTASQTPLDTLQRWQLLSAAGRAIDLNPTEQALLQDAPASGAPAAAYIEWAGQVLTSLDLSLATLQAQEADLVSQREAISRSWNEALGNSGGLSAHLRVEALPGADQPTKKVHTPAAAALIGGIVGVLVWILFWLVRPLRKARA
jgi:hypothetical protein